MTEVSNISQMPEHPQSSGFREGTPVHLTSFLPLDAVNSEAQESSYAPCWMRTHGFVPSRLLKWRFGWALRSKPGGRGCRIQRHFQHTIRRFEP